MAIIDGTSDPDLLNGTEFADNMHGFESDDFLRALGGNDEVFGGNANDQLNGGEGDDILSGDDGLDRVSFYDYTHTIFTGSHASLLLMGVAQDTGHGMDLLRSIEHLSGTQFSDVLIGDGGDNWLWGQSLDFDGMTRTANADRLTGNGGNDLMTVGSGDHILRGGADVDTVSVFDANGAVVMSLALQGAAQDTGEGLMNLKGFENLSGSDFNDTLVGNDRANVLLGAFGDDTLLGGKGRDTLYADGLMSIDGIGYSGPITIFADATEEVTDHDGNPANGNDTLKGGDGADWLYGAGGADSLSGGTGKDGFTYRMTTDSKPGGGEDTIVDLQSGDWIDVFAIDANILTPGDDAFTPVPVLTGAVGELALRYDAVLGKTVLELETDGDGIVDMRVLIDGHHAGFSNFYY